MLDARPTTRRITLGEDKNYDTHQFVQDLRALQVTPHVAQHTTNRASAIDGRTTRHPGYTVSQQKRKRVEEIFGWLFTFAAAVYNLVRMRNLMEAATWCDTVPPGAPWPTAGLYGGTHPSTDGCRRLV